jgi:hypothetical protein
VRLTYEGLTLNPGEAQVLSGKLLRALAERLAGEEGAGELPSHVAVPAINVREGRIAPEDFVERVARALYPPIRQPPAPDRRGVP